MRSELVAVALSAVATLAGCGGANSVSGHVAGAAVVVKDAYYVVDDGAYDNGDDDVHLWLVGVKDGCSHAVSWQSDVGQAETSADEAAAWSRDWPEDFWWVEAHFRVPDAASLPTSLDGDAWDSVDQGTGEASLHFTHYLQALDARYFDGAADDADYRADYAGNGGSVTLDPADGDVLAGEYDTTAVDVTGRDQGEVTVRFEAPRCNDLEALLFR